MDKLEAMRVFVTVAEEGGFAAAARRLRLSAPAVTRAIAALEEGLGTRLLHRTTRVVRISAAGERFLADAKRILLAVEEAEASATGSHRAIRGPLTITASTFFGRLHVAPVLLDFLAAYPEVTARALFVDRVEDLVAEGLDVAVRIAELPDSSLGAVRVGALRSVVCASPSYLRRSRKLRTPDDLEKHDCIAFDAALARQDWSFRTHPSARPPRARVTVNSAPVVVDAALAGRGLVRVLSYMVGPHVQKGALTIVLAEFEPPPIPVHLVHAEPRREHARVRAFVDFAAPRLRKVLREVL